MIISKKHSLIRTSVLAGSLIAGSYAADKPNVIVIVSDDAGYADWGFMDSFTGNTTKIATPNLDALRAKGTLFTSAYTGMVSSPSRGAITTGCYQNRFGYEFNIKNSNGSNSRDGHYNSTVLAFEHFKPLGYTTGAIGKWHVGCGGDNENNIKLGNNRPQRQGVDEFFGIWQGSRNYTLGGAGDGANDIDALRETFVDNEGNVSGTVLEKLTDLSTGVINKPNPAKFSDSDLSTWSGMNVTNAFGRGAMNFIDRHYDDADPFFLYVAYTAPHSPMHNSPDFDDPRLASLSGTRKQYASMVLTMDKEIGRMMNQLDDPNGDGDTSDSITDNTLIVFVNDNGGAKGEGSVNDPLRDHKFSPYEGGIRVPMLMTGPGIPVNSTYDKAVHTIDIVPTCLAAAGDNLNFDFDGVNLIPFIDGTDNSSPHEYITVRQGVKMGLRKDNWKLVKKSGIDFQLYNLADDISESNNLATSEPEKLEELKRLLTDAEVKWDKPRHDGYREGAINHNNGFVAAPATPEASVGFNVDLVLVGGNIRNGNFNAGTDKPYQDTPYWTNVGTAGQSENATNTNNDYDGTRNAVLNEEDTRIHGLDTEHTLTTGEVFKASYVWYDASGWSDANDRIRTSLFVTDNNQITGTKTVIESLDSKVSSSNSAYQSEEMVFSAIDAAHNGKRLFIMIHGLDGNGDTGGFARLDNFALERGQVDPGAIPSMTFKWGDNSVWLSGETGSTMTMKTWDSYPGAYFEFPSKPFNYTSENDQIRMTGLDYMLNRLIFSGDDATSTSLDGLPILLVNDLDGNAPKIELNRTAGSVTISSDLILYNDLEVTGDGAASFTINGKISEFSGKAGIIKSGSSELLINKNTAYTGNTVVNGGALTVAPTVTLAGPVAMSASTTLKGNGTISGAVTVTGKVAPGQSIGTLTVESLDLDGSLENEIDGSATDKLIVTGSLDITGATLDIIDISTAQNGLSGNYVIVSYGSITGTFASVNGLPSGYIIDYSYNNGSNTRNIALIDTTAAAHGTVFENTYYPFKDIAFGTSDGSTPYTDQALGVFYILDDTETNTLLLHDVTSDAAGTVYKDHTSLTPAASIVRNNSYVIKLRNWAGAKKRWGVQGWADWNGDGDFADANEQLISKMINSGSGYINQKETFTVPADAVDNVLIRIRTFKASADALTENNDPWGDSASDDFTGVRDFKLTVDGLTPAIGLEVTQTDNLLSWTVEDEIGVKEYLVVDANGNIVARVPANQKGSYSVTLDSNEPVSLIVVDNSGYRQTYKPEDGNEQVTTYDLNQGWNLIAITSENSDIEPLKTATSGVIWSWNGTSYEAVYSAEPTNAVWVYSPIDQQIDVRGKKSTAKISLNSGWNMVGPVENDYIPEDAAAVYSWNDLYTEVAGEDKVLIEGVGYWIFSVR